MSSLTDTVNVRFALIHGFFMNAAEYQKENEYKTVKINFHLSFMILSRMSLLDLFLDNNKTTRLHTSVISFIQFQTNMHFIQRIG